MPVVIHDVEITNAPRAAEPTQAPAGQAAEAAAPVKPSTAELQAAEMERRERALRVFAH